MTPERAQLIQDLAKIELADMMLSRARYNAEPNFARRLHLSHSSDWTAAAWTMRVEAAQFNPTEEAEFQRVRAEFMLLATPALNVRSENAR